MIVLLYSSLKGKPLTPVINKKQSEINGCKVNVTWSSRSICTTTKTAVRFREIKPQDNKAEWTEYHVPSTNFYLLSLECGKEYEIGVSSFFRTIQSDWSVSWKVKTVGTTTSFVY